MNLSRITCAFALVASLCFVTGIAVLSHEEGDETAWID